MHRHTHDSSVPLLYLQACHCLRCTHTHKWEGARVRAKSCLFVCISAGAPWSFQQPWGLLFQIVLSQDARLCVCVRGACVVRANVFACVRWCERHRRSQHVGALILSISLIESCGRAIRHEVCRKHMQMCLKIEWVVCVFASPNMRTARWNVVQNSSKKSKTTNPEAARLPHVCVWEREKERERENAGVRTGEE